MQIDERDGHGSGSVSRPPSSMAAWTSTSASRCRHAEVRGDRSGRACRASEPGQQHADGAQADVVGAFGHRCMTNNVSSRSISVNPAMLIYRPKSRSAGGCHDIVGLARVWDEWRSVAGWRAFQRQW